MHKSNPFSISALVSSLVFCCAAASAQETHYGVGIAAGSLTGNYGYYQRVGGKNISVGFDIEFWQKLKGSDFGYTIAVSKRDPEKNNERDLLITDRYVAQLLNFKVGADYTVKKYGIDLLANISYGRYYQKRDYLFWEHDEESSFIIGPLIARDMPLLQNGTIGLELGVKKHLAKGLWGQASYNYVDLDKDRLGVGRVSWAEVSVKYMWGKYK